MAPYRLGPPGPAPHNRPESSVTPRTPRPITHHLKPRLATALFRRYLHACVVRDRGSPLATGALGETHRLGTRP